MNIFMCNTVSNVVSALSIANTMKLDSCIIFSHQIFLREEYFRREYQMIPLPCYIIDNEMNNKILKKKKKTLNKVLFYKGFISEVLREQKLKSADIQRIFIYQDNDEASKSIIGLFRKSNIEFIGVDEGTSHRMSKKHHLKMLAPSWDKYAKHVIANIIEKFYFGKYYRSRFHRNCEQSLFKKFIVHHPVEQVDQGYVRSKNNIEHIGIDKSIISSFIKFPWDELRKHANSNIFLGSPLSEDNILTLQEENCLLKQIFMQIDSLPHVYIKPHPRDRRGKYEEFLAKNIKLIDLNYPVQFYDLVDIEFDLVIYILTSCLPPHRDKRCFIELFAKYNSGYASGVKDYVFGELIAANERIPN